MFIRLFQQHIFVSSVLAITTLMLIGNIVLFLSVAAPRPYFHTHPVKTLAKDLNMIGVLAEEVVVLTDELEVQKGHVARLAYLNTNARYNIKINSAMISENLIIQSEIARILGHVAQNGELVNQATEFRQVGRALQIQTEEEMEELGIEMDRLHELIPTPTP